MELSYDLHHPRRMNGASPSIPSYAYGGEAMPKSSISAQELEQIKNSVGFSRASDGQVNLRL